MAILRGICECGNPKEHTRRNRPPNHPPDGSYCWTEPERRPDGTRLLFPHLPDQAGASK